MNRLYREVWVMKRLLLLMMMIFINASAFTQNAELDSTFRVFLKPRTYNVKLITSDTTAELAKRDIPALARTFMFLRSKKWVAENADMEIRIYIDSVTVNEPDLNIVRTRKIDHMDRDLVATESDQFKASATYSYRLNFWFVYADTITRHFKFPGGIKGTTEFKAGTLASYNNKGVQQYSSMHNASKTTADNEVTRFKRRFKRNIALLTDDIDRALRDYRKQVYKP